MNPFNFYFMCHMPRPIIVCMLHMNYFDNLKKKDHKYSNSVASLQRGCELPVCRLMGEDGGGKAPKSPSTASEA